MYANNSPQLLVQRLLLAICPPLCLLAAAVQSQPAVGQTQVIRNITQATERLELTVNTSRILTLEKRIPRMVVNNPELVSVTPISATQVQLAARKPGVTQVNLWDEDNNVYTVDVLIYGDVRELELALQRIFPESSIKVVRLTNSLVLEGYVEKPESVSPIIRLAEDYAPKVVNNITVGGVQQVLLRVQVMEVSRTKLRNLGHDFALNVGEFSIVSNVSDLLQSFSIPPGSAGSNSFSLEGIGYGVVGDDAQFFGFLQALQENKIAKVLANPTLTTVSGRPAKFNVGGEFPIVVPSGLNQATVEFKDFGTRVDFVPIVLGNGNIRLEVRPRVSEPDFANGITQNGFQVPALTVREVDTGVEMKAGQTLALAGLIQTKIEANERGIPYLCDIPYAGALFRQVKEEVNEIELLILVTPEFADGMDPHEVPPCGPGMETVSPSNCELYWGGHLEVPACGPCAPTGCGLDCSNSYNPIQPTGCYPTGAANGGCAPTSGAQYDYAGDMGSGYQQWQQPQNYSYEYSDGAASPGETYQPAIPEQAPASAPQEEMPALDSSARSGSTPYYQARQSGSYSRQTLQDPSLGQPAPPATATPGLMGPIGYDIEK